MCQIRAAGAALVQSWWLPRAAADRLLDRAARIIRDTQDRKARARKSHRKRTLRKLHAIGITLGPPATMRVEKHIAL